MERSQQSIRLIKQLTAAHEGEIKFNSSMVRTFNNLTVSSNNDDETSHLTRAFAKIAFGKLTDLKLL